MTLNQHDPAIAVLMRHYDEAVRKAFDSMGRYKYEMFGYWASKSVSIGHMIVDLGGTRPPSPFKALVHAARETTPPHTASGSPWPESWAFALALRR